MAACAVLTGRCAHNTDVRKGAFMMFMFYFMIDDQLFNSLVISTLPSCESLSLRWILLSKSHPIVVSSHPVALRQPPPSIT